MAINARPVKPVILHTVVRLTHSFNFHALVGCFETCTANNFRKPQGKMTSEIGIERKIQYLKGSYMPLYFIPHYKLTNETCVVNGWY
jgi:hypothetical protein